MKGLPDFLSRNGAGRWGLALPLLLVFLAVAAPWLAPADPTRQDLAARLLGPSLVHWMGTDELGRDILSRIFYGARISMIVSVSVVLGAGIVGVTIGSLSASLAGGLAGLLTFF